MWSLCSTMLLSQCTDMLNLYHTLAVDEKARRNAANSVESRSAPILIQQYGIRQALFFDKVPE
jgi:hypothetical protein